jgi:hypothetical protein
MNNKRPPPSNSAFIFRKAFIAFFKQQRAEKPNDGTPKQGTGNAGEREGSTRQDKGAFAINVLLMLFTLVIAGAAVYQGWEIKEEFRVGNTPYLQISPIMDSIHPGEKPIIVYQLQDLSKVPCKIMWVEAGDSVSNQPKVPTFPFGALVNLFASKVIRDSINRYSIEGSPFTNQSTAGYVLTDTVYKQLKKETAFLYFYGTFDYINQINGEERIYQCSIKIHLFPVGAGAIETLINDNMTYQQYQRKNNP